MKGSRAYLPILLTLVLLTLGCGGNGNADISLDGIEVNLHSKRLDLDLHQASLDLRQDTSLSSGEIWKRYFEDDRRLIASWLAYGDDSLLNEMDVAGSFRDFAADSYGAELLDTVAKVFSPETWSLEQVFEEPFRRFKYYFPNRAIPALFTYVDGFPPTVQAGLDQVFLSRTHLGVGLHYFLGPDYAYYPPDMPRYIRKRCSPDKIAVVTFTKLAEAMVPDPELNSNPGLIDFMVKEGIRQHLVDKLLGPSVPDSVKLFYDPSELEWAEIYESRIYKDMLPHLYTFDPQVLRTYLDESPYTSQLSRESAPRMGRYVGWKIVQAYLEKNPEMSMDELLGNRDFRKIYKDSGYRPESKED